MRIIRLEVMSWRTNAVLAQIALLLYLETVEWVDLYPWNDIRSGNGQAGLDLFLGAALAFGAVATWRRWRLPMVVALAGISIWTILRIMTWWIPYFRGASPAWQRVYTHNFAATTHLFAPQGIHLPPDANHLVLQVLLAAALVSLAGALRRQTK
jgi:hypothetical protein